MACVVETAQVHASLVDGVLCADDGRYDIQGDGVWLGHEYPVREQILAKATCILRAGKKSVDPYSPAQLRLVHAWQRLGRLRRYILFIYRHLPWIRPYAVKEFEKRCYIVAYSEEADALRTYAMDRIVSMQRTGRTFRMPPGFNVDDLFEGSYGIYLPEQEKPVIIKIKATERE